MLQLKILLYIFNSLIWLTGLAEVVSMCSCQPKLITRDKNELYHFLHLKPSIGVGTFCVKTIYWSGDFLERFFQFDPSLTSGMSAALMQGHCLRRRPAIKQHMSSGREFHPKYHRQLPPHLTRHETLHALGLD